MSVRSVELSTKFFDDCCIGSWRGKTVVLMERIDFRIRTLRTGCGTSRRGSLGRHGGRSGNVI